jgi:hypothetical protein
MSSEVLAATSHCSYSLFVIFQSFHITDAMLYPNDNTIVILPHAFSRMSVVVEMILHCGSPVNLATNSHYSYNLLTIF